MQKIAINFKTQQKNSMYFPFGAKDPFVQLTY